MKRRSKGRRAQGIAVAMPDHGSLVGKCLQDFPAGAVNVGAAGSQLSGNSCIFCGNKAVR